MRNGFLALLLVVFAALPASAQTEAPSFLPGLTPWQPPAADHDERPDVGPRGYPIYGQVDYLLWWTEKDRPLNGVFAPADDFGPLLRNGVRTILGCWLDTEQRYGVEAGGFWLLERSPVAEGVDGALGWRTQLVSRLGGAETELRGQVYRGTWANADLLGGLRFLSFDEGLEIFERPDSAITSDRFGAHNRFYGGQLGAEIECHYGKWFADLWGKVALGGTDEEVHIDGTTLAAGRAVPGGLLATPALSGSWHRDAFAVLPEVGVNTGWQLTNTIRLSAGYTFFYISDVARPGDQIQGLVDGVRPPVVHGSGFWGQGLNFGVEFRF